MIRSKLLFAGSGFWHVKNSLLLFWRKLQEQLQRAVHSKVYAAHALDKGIIVMTQTKNMEVSTKYCDLGEETVFVAFEVAPVLLVGTHLAGKLVGGRHTENVEIFIN